MFIDRFRPFTITLAALLLAATACPNGDDDTSAESTTSPLPTLPATSPTEDVTGSGATDPTADPITTSSDTSSTGEPSDSTTGAPPDCYDPDDEVECSRITIQFATFCESVGQLLLAHEVEEPYNGFVLDICAAEGRCNTCFNLQNYCIQVGVDCDGLLELCACYGEEFGVP